MAKKKVEKEEELDSKANDQEIEEETSCENTSRETEDDAGTDSTSKAEEEIAELKRQLLYKIAEFDNYRKRTMAEKAELILNGGEKTIKAILPVMDDMERALEQMKKADDVSAVVEGVELIRKKFTGILEKLGVKAIETEGEDFNVDLHEAIAQVPAPSEELKNKIIDCTLKGYKLNDKVIRHSQVVVGM